MKLFNDAFGKPLHSEKKKHIVYKHTFEGLRAKLKLTKILIENKIHANDAQTVSNKTSE